MGGAKAKPLSEADLAAIKGFVEPWREAWISRDWDAVMMMCTEDITIQMPGVSPLSGEAFRAWLESSPIIRGVEWKFTHAEGTDHLAVVLGTGVQVVEHDGETVRIPGKYCDIFRKDDDGRWLMACISWMPDTP